MNGEELAITRRILLACALTYVSQSLLAVLTLRFWLLMLTRA
jgi:Zn-dependent membrane protease YugP